MRVNKVPPVPRQNSEVAQDAANRIQLPEPNLFEIIGRKEAQIVSLALEVKRLRDASSKLQIELARVQGEKSNSGKSA